MNFKTKYGMLDDLKVTYFFIGARSSMDYIAIGPFESYEAAFKNLKSEDRAGCIGSCTAYGLQALKILEKLEK